MLKYVIFFVCLSFVKAQMPSFGKCPDYSVVTDFEADKYLGKWYEQRKYFAFFELGGKCVTATYTSEEGKIGVLNSQIQIRTGNVKTISGYAEFVEKPNVGKLQVIFPSVPKAKGSYWVLDTDYTSYSIVWSCRNILNGYMNVQNAWILTRERNPSKDALNKIIKSATNIGLRSSFLLTTDQSNCPA